MSRPHGGDQLRHLDVVGITARVAHLPLEIRVVAFGDLDVRIDDEDHLTPLRAKALTTTALARLDDDRVALWRARYRKRPARTEITTLVIEAVNPWLREQAGCLVLDDGIVLPRVPMA